MEKSAGYRPPRLVAKRYEILRNVMVGSARDKAVALAECPIRVATLIDEQGFLARGELVHNVNVFLEDRHHDWQWHNGLFYYYSRVTTISDVVAVYELEKQ